ncbi:TRAP-type C4-dicarboxylate transport system, small permease component [Thalassovita gelatinovora]|uniref:TRAP transporter small permease protein n=1 Tax=Thalassovita gelatinovora TaxID=53501 RepID=A0A0N7LVC0_THAGE|nr:TRAP transporter small permease [Thalassovita gelatinovora]QIZ80458.1 TRAP transporter small permease [Thalassovita gelatinovora]CUH65874.1 TRAP-type C4-dicarboxylate transport system, small permease component [Thalassovita gelatinovora]SEQ73034.1 TRAP-type mannitol/chloroaromatic compound transport system, small permease component [Thalassovita gelatinovora]
MRVSNDAQASGWIGRCDRFMMPVEDAANFIAATFIFLLMLLGVAQIVMRTFFNNPLSGYIDLVELSMAGMAFLGAAYTQRMGAHIRMELLLGRLWGRSYWLAEIVGSLLGMAIVAVLIWYSWDHFLRSYQIGDTTIDAEYPVWPSKLLVPIAFAFWFLRLGIQLAGSVRLFIYPSHAHEGVVSLKDAAETAREEAHEVLGDEADKEGR